jgi:phosphocarrier protein FPr/phosphocarrier protein
MTTLLAPLAGWAAPLDEVPDPVFAERMMGEGLAIDPTGEVLAAPCEGTVIKVHAARHAVTLRTPEGAEVLLHLGLDTVALGGEGFTAHVADGARVSAGQTLVSFDLDGLAQRARSLITPVLVTNPEAFAVEVLASGREVAIGEPILRLVARGATTAGAAAGPRAERRVLVTHAHGLHARPAARIAAEVKRWNAAVRADLDGRSADAASAVGLMTLGVSAGDEIVLSAQGPDADAALAALAEVVAQINAAPAPTPLAAIAPAARPRSAPGVIPAVRAAPGLAAGPAWRLKLAEAPLAEAASGAAAETQALEAALAAARRELSARMAHLGPEARAVTAAHLTLLEDPALLDPARRGIAEGLSAGLAWKRAAQAQADAVAQLSDPRLAERAADLKDLEQRVLWALAGRRPDPPPAPPGAVLIAEDLLPSDLAGLEGAGLAGLCTARGGPTSHVAVLAAAMDIPALVAAGPQVLQVADGASVVLDADAGALETRPDAARLESVRAELAARAAAKAAALKAAAEPARTADGARIEVFANVGALADAEPAVNNGAEGCGLLRTEFLFLDRATPPSEDEQAGAYQAIAAALAPRPVIVRTLDVGGDKPAPYLDLAAEENPALGVRGLRVGLRRPELLTAQLRAILRVEPAGQCRIMLPMVASVGEIQAVRALLSDAAAALGRPLPPLGVMVETPAAAATTDLIAPHVDFISVGTNDLAQYVLAMDRGNPALAAEVDALHPAVLRLIRMAAQGAGGLPVGVCGGLASDPAAVPILIGLGVTELSVTPARVAATKAELRALDLTACRELATRACAQASAAEVRALGLASRPASRPARRARKGARA